MSAKRKKARSRKRKMIRNITIDILSVLLFIYSMLLSMPITKDNSETISGTVHNAWVKATPGRGTDGFRLFLSIDENVYIFQTRAFNKDELKAIADALLKEQTQVSLMIPKFQPIPFSLAGWREIAAISCESKTIYSIDAYNNVQRESRVETLILFPILWLVFLPLQYMDFFLKCLYKICNKRKKKAKK